MESRLASVRLHQGYTRGRTNNDTSQNFLSPSPSAPRDTGTRDTPRDDVRAAQRELIEPLAAEDERERIPGHRRQRC